MSEPIHVHVYTCQREVNPQNIIARLDELDRRYSVLRSDYEKLKAITDHISEQVRTWDHPEPHLNCSFYAQPWPPAPVRKPTPES